jgi:hypothetical protein
MYVAREAACSQANGVYRPVFDNHAASIDLVLETTRGELREKRRDSGRLTDNNYSRVSVDWSPSSDRGTEGPVR